ncbi:MAG: universal stress protein [Chloroflexi bacterium]|nr:MAG: universal stress protein [Chloroflexota bacterium]
MWKTRPGNCATRASTECAVRFGRPVEEIIEQANEQGADVIAMTTHGRTGLARIVSGSVTSRVIKEAGCPVLAVRRPASSTNQRTGPCRHVPEPVRQRTLAALSPALRRQHRIQPSPRFRD